MSKSRHESHAAQTLDNSRRRFLGFRAKGSVSAIRPPWTDNSEFTGACTRCDLCVTACPEGVLLRGDGGFPEFAPAATASACIFCGACAEACPENLFQTTNAPPFEARVFISSEMCLAEAGIHCECCRDACDHAALKFRPQLGGPARPVLDVDRCTACGACISVCPNNAIKMGFEPRKKEAA